MVNDIILNFNRALVLDNPQTFKRISMDICGDIKRSRIISHYLSLENMHMHSITSYPNLDIIVRAEILSMIGTSGTCTYYDVVNVVVRSIVDGRIPVVKHNKPSEQNSSNTLHLMNAKKYYKKLSFTELDKMRQFLIKLHDGAKSFCGSTHTVPDAIQSDLDILVAFTRNIDLIRVKKIRKQSIAYFKSKSNAVMYALDNYEEGNRSCNAILGIDVDIHIISKSVREEIVRDATNNDVKNAKSIIDRMDAIHERLVDRKGYRLVK